jgi:glycosyltransferase involved in cell wall biosynthesis
MKILHVLGTGRLPQQPDQSAMSGLVTAVLEIARCQAAIGHQVTVVSIGTRRWSASWQNVTLLGLPWLPWASIRLGGRALDFRRHLPLLLHCLSGGYDVIHTHLNNYVRGLRGRRKILHFHGDPFYPGSDPAQRLDLKPADFARILHDSHAQIAVSRFVASRLQIGFNQRGNVHTIYNGIDLDRFQGFDPAARRTYRSKYNLPEDARVILYAGAVIQEKGVIHLARAFTYLLDTINNVVLVLAGDSNLWGNDVQADSQAEYAEMVKRALSGARAAGKTFFLGKQPYDEMPNIYQMSEIVVVPSIWEEAFGLVALEALAAGKPVIATRTGGMGEFLTDRNSIRARPGDEPGLAQAMLRLLSDDALYQRLARQARQDAQKYSWETAVKQILAVYET